MKLRPMPTEHQLAVWAWIKKFTLIYGRGPLLREVGEAFSIERQGVCNLCRRLHHYGLIDRPNVRGGELKFKEGA